MQLAEIVPDAVSRRLELYRLNARLRPYGPSMADDLLASVEESADLERIKRLWTEMKPEFRREPTSAAKYANRRYWLLLNIYRAAQLGLQSDPKLRIMDIGCGPGYFLAVARALGHQPQGVDAPASFLTPVERKVYTELLAALGCSRNVSPLLIERFVPLPFGDERYDLITAFWICFNRHRQVDSWGVDEWRFFVEDAVHHLREGGRLLLELNEDAARYGERRFYDEATLAYFRSVGLVDRQRVLIARSQTAPVVR